MASVFQKSSSLPRRPIPKRVLIENLIIALLGAFSLAMLLLSFFPAAPLSGMMLRFLEMKKMASRVFSAALLITLYHLYRRKKTALYITVFLLALNLVRQLWPPMRHGFSVVTLVDAVLLVLLLWFRGDFCCRSEKRSLRRAVVALGFAVAAILLNAGLGYHFVKLQVSGTPDRVLWWQSFQEALGILFGTTNSNERGFPSVRFENFMFWFSWCCILAALLYSLLPWIERRLWNERDMQRARELVLRYGQNSTSYLALEDDKLLYFSKCAPGVLPYGVVGSTVLVNGDPICAPEDFPAVLAEFRDFCWKCDHKLAFLSISERFAEEYRRQGFGVAKCGEEAVFDLAAYDLAGKKGAKMRMNINHAAKAGLTVHEYKPQQQRDPGIEAAMNHITQEWLADKKSGLLTFTMGTVGLERPLDRRYFYAADPAGQICGYNVYCPYQGGYMADITRRSHSAPSGVTEKIMYEAMQVFRAEGVHTLSLGIAPLANLMPEGADPTAVERLLNFVYEHLNDCYGFKDLYRAKQNYSPTEWVCGYYAWLPKFPTPEMLYAIVRIQNKQGLADYARAFFAARRESRAAAAAEKAEPASAPKE